MTGKKCRENVTGNYIRNGRETAGKEPIRVEIVGREKSDNSPSKKVNRPYPTLTVQGSGEKGRKRSEKSKERYEKS